MNLAYKNDYLIDDYDFIGESYQTFFPNLHKYPATMLPQIGVKLCHEFNVKGKIAVDPFCGSGSSFIGPIMQNFEIIHGYDLNFLATKITQTRYTKFNLMDLKKIIIDFSEKIQNLIVSDNGNDWFPPNIISTSQHIKKLISELNENYHNFFLIALAESYRKCSYTRQNEFKLYRIPELERINFRPKLSQIIMAMLKEKFNIQQQNQLLLDNYNYQHEVHHQQFEKFNQGIDCVLTSPPYGDSSTTVAYGQFSSFGNEILENKSPKNLDNFLMGGKKANELYEKYSISKQIKLISQIDYKRALEVSSFYQDCEPIIENIATKMNRNGYVFFVVGNRTVKNINLASDVFFKEIFEDYGLRHIRTIFRNISNKTMPLVNSPSNIAGENAKTMTKEFIVVLKKGR